ncbi:MAG: hypothetical protein LBH68_00900, partial [Bifidobacteriaceae bacterium]|nr:hypothetical protein [Bifidobacteriaceae bacterium]
MQVWNSLTDVPADFGPSVVTLGNFDGVHLGHQFLVSTVVERAHAIGAKPVAVTFYPHPAAVHHPERHLVQLQPLPERLATLEKLGMAATLVVPYSLDFAQLTPEQFVRTYLIDGLHAREVVVGQD